MKLRKLGSSNLMVSAIAVGCWAYGSTKNDYWGAQEQADVDISVKSAIDKGINFFDTALGYNGGRSEIALGKALKGMREKAIICDKIPNRFEPNEYEKTVDLMLKNLDMDYMDLLLLHWPTKTDDDTRARLAAMVKLKEKGKVLNIGVSNFGVKQLSGLQEFLPHVCANELCHSILSRGIEVDIAGKCMDENIGIIGYSPLSQGLLTGKYDTIEDIPHNYTRTRQYNLKRDGSRHGGAGVEDVLMQIVALLKNMSKKLDISPAQIALAWSIAKAGITTTIVGCRNEKQLESNRVAGTITLPRWAIKEIDDISWPIVEKIGASPDYYQSAEASRIW